MISQIFVISSNIELLFEKDYRHDTTSSDASNYCKHLKNSRNVDIHPNIILNGVHFYNIRRNGVYFVACSASELSPIMVIEILTRFYHLCKDFLGVINDQTIQANILLIFEILEEFMNEGYIQLSSTEKLCPYLQSNPVIIHTERSPAKEISSRVFGIESRTVSESASSKPVVQSPSSNVKKELYIDVVEKMKVVVEADSTISHLEVNGTVNVKNYLTGSPQITMKFNEDLVVSGTAKKGYGSNVQLDRCSFHTCVKDQDFTTSHQLTLVPPIGEVGMVFNTTNKGAMTYTVNGKMCLNQPFSLRCFFGNSDSSRDVMVTIRLQSHFSSKITAVNVKVKFPVPDAVSSVSSRLSSDQELSELCKDEKQVIWTIKKLPGQTEAMASFRLINQETRAISRQDIGPIALEFEISGYTSSGFRIRHLKFIDNEKYQQQSQQWIRHITINDSYIFRTC